ncbi:MAG: DUF1549 domain-containing protein [Bryobacterales bacterium]|nr:DUF1549 domain-containing protein [Bryobacterales bacterium]
MLSLIALLLAAPVDFATDVHPILTARCIGCHNSRLSQGGLALETSAQVGKSVVAGSSAASILIKRVTGEVGPRMPLNSPALTPTEIGLLKRWVDEGAKGPAGVEKIGWKPKLELTAPMLPQSAETHPIDKFLNPGRAAASDAVSDTMFARRAYLDIWGLLPTPEQTAEFEQDQSAGKHAKLVDRLLADNAKYADHWISFWNDHLRNDEGVVYHGDRKSITPWLRDALLANMPYDKFVQGLLNPAEKTGPEGFLIGVNWRGDVSASQIPVMQAAQNTAQVFLGINLKCNSCHDSFISQWKLRDAYGLASFFSEKPLQIHRCDVPTGAIAPAKFLYPELGSVSTDAPLAEKRAAVANLFTKPANGRTPRTIVNRYWKVLFGRGIVEPVDDMDAQPWNPHLLDWLAADFASNAYDLKHLLKQIMTSKAYRMPSTQAEDTVPYTFQGPKPRRLSAEQFVDAVSSITGEWRVLEPRSPGASRYARDWQLKSSALGRALGRAIRDQVITERQNQPTTLQALEIVNGETLTSQLHRGALRLRDQLPPPPQNLFDSGAVNAQKVKIDVEIAGAEKLWLVLIDVDSYDPLRTRAAWGHAGFDTGALALPTEPVKFKGDNEPTRAVIAKVPSTLVVDVPAGAKRFQATVGVDEASLASDINPRVRFFVFRRQPDMKRLMPVEGEAPVPQPEPTTDSTRLIARLYRHALGRQPSKGEQTIALDMVRTTDGLEDFLWSLVLSPEFEYVR